MGWDQLANAMGGFLGGAVLGVALAVILVKRLSLPVLRRTAIVSGVVTAALVGYVLWRVNARQPLAPEPIRNSPTAVPPPQPGG
jgi:hypothetical protein